MITQAHLHHKKNLILLKKFMQLIQPEVNLKILSYNTTERYFIVKCLYITLLSIIISTHGLKLHAALTQTNAKPFAASQGSAFQQYKTPLSLKKPEECHVIAFQQKPPQCPSKQQQRKTFNDHKHKNDYTCDSSLKSSSPALESEDY